MYNYFRRLAGGVALSAMATPAITQQTASPGAAASASSPDGELLQQLARSGSDLEQLHHFDFTLRFPTQKAAEQAEMALMEFAFKSKISSGNTREQRVINATKRMYPVESDLRGLRDKLLVIAKAGGGTYEGWKARIAVKDPA